MTDKDTTLAAKRHIGILLRTCGTDAEVPALARMLGDDQVGDAARGALERIPGKAAGAALREALTRLQGRALAGAINSTANRHDREAVGTLIQLAARSDAGVSSAAVHALGRIGGTEAAAALAGLVASAKGPAPVNACNTWLSCGILAKEAGDAEGARAVFSALADAKYPAAVRRAALQGQLETAKDRAELVLTWLDGNDADARRIALGNIAAQPSPWLLAACKGRPVAKAISFAEILAARGDRGALPILLGAVQQTDDVGLRVRGIAATRLVADKATEDLLIAATAEPAPVGPAAVNALSAMPAGSLDARLIEAFVKAPGAQRASLADVLIERKTTSFVPVLLEQAKIEDDEELRSAVVRSLKGLSGPDVLPKLVGVVLGAKDRAHRDVIETTYLEISESLEDVEARSKPIFDAMTGDERRENLLPLLGRVGGKAALAAVQSAITGDKPAIRAAGIRALCNWPNADVAQQLAKLAEKDDSRDVRVAALRAYIRVVTLKSERSATETLEMLKKAYGMAERPEEQRLAVRRAEAVRHVKTLQWLAGLLDNEAVRQDACSSIVELAHHRDLRNPNREEFSKALRKVIAAGKEGSVVDQAKRYLEGM